jgi:hypothetical protein
VERLGLVRGPGGLLRVLSIVAVALSAALPLGCVPSPAPPAANPFIGDWVTAENAGITIGQDTIVQHQPDGQSTILGNSTCGGVFRFAYGTKSREMLSDLVPRQPDLRQRLSQLLIEPSYPVVELNCDRGDQTYVLLDARNLLAIYRDGEIGAIERLARR